MRCNICDKALTDKEVVWNKDLSAYEPCTECLEVAMDAAYCDGFDTEDDSFVLIDSDDTNLVVPAYSLDGLPVGWVSKHGEPQ